MTLNNAADLFARANAAYVDEDYTAALKLYSEAIEQDAQQPEYWLKRSVAHQKLQHPREALQDIEHALACAQATPLHQDATWMAKAYNRQGVVAFDLKDYPLAHSSFTRVLQLLPGDKSAHEWLQKCTAMLPVLPASAAASRTEPKIRYEWFQNDQAVTLSIFVKNCKQENVQIEFHPRSVSVTIQLPSGSDYSLELDPLSHEIDTSACTTSLRPSKVELRLQKKQVGVMWRHLEGEEDPLAAPMASVETTGKAPSYPSSSRKKVDWNALEKNVEEEKPEGEQALNALFQKIYADGSDDVRKAMMKSFVESGGTTLSTNWDEIKKDHVPVRPPEGMVARKWYVQSHCV